MDAGGADLSGASRHEIGDLHWLAYRASVKLGSEWAAGGDCDTVTWACGGRTAPITGRGQASVTPELAKADSDGPPLRLRPRWLRPRGPTTSS